MRHHATTLHPPGCIAGPERGCRLCCRAPCAVPSCAFLLPWKNTLSLPFPRLAGKLILVLRLCLRTSILPVPGNISPSPPYVRDRKRLFPQCREPCLFVGNSPHSRRTFRQKWKQGGTFAPPCPYIFVFAPPLLSARLSVIPDRPLPGRGSGIFPCPPPRARGCPLRWDLPRHRRPP